MNAAPVITAGMWDLDAHAMLSAVARRLGNDIDRIDRLELGYWEALQSVERFSEPRGSVRADPDGFLHIDHPISDDPRRSWIARISSPSTPITSVRQARIWDYPIDSVVTWHPAGPLILPGGFTGCVEGNFPFLPFAGESHTLLFVEPQESVALYRLLDTPAGRLTRGMGADYESFVHMTSRAGIAFQRGNVKKRTKGEVHFDPCRLFVAVTHHTH